jgi:2-oxoglutarate dehydrogenase E2 component (dihydrolipoamide succinyltransferase)
MRQRIAQRLKDAQNTAAMLTTFQEVDMTNLIALRNNYKDSFEKIHVRLPVFNQFPLHSYLPDFNIPYLLQGVKLGFMSAFVSASRSALVEQPVVNGYIDDETQEIVYRNYVDISGKNTFANKFQILFRDNLIFRCYCIFKSLSPRPLVS